MKRAWLGRAAGAAIGAAVGTAMFWGAGPLVHAAEPGGQPDAYPAVRLALFGDKKEAPKWTDATPAVTPPRLGPRGSSSYVPNAPAAAPARADAADKRPNLSAPIDISVTQIQAVRSEMDFVNGLDIRLNAAGAQIEQTTLRRCRLTRAVDDTGADLLTSNRPPARFEAYGLQVELKLPERKAQVVRELSGVVEMIRPERDPQSRLQVGGFAGKDWTEVSNPALTANGVRLMIVSYAEFQRLNSLLGGSVGVPLALPAAGSTTPDHVDLTPDSSPALPSRTVAGMAAGPTVGAAATPMPSNPTPWPAASQPTGSAPAQVAFGQSVPAGNVSPPPSAAPEARPMYAAPMPAAPESPAVAFPTVEVYAQPGVHVPPVKPAGVAPKKGLFGRVSERIVAKIAGAILSNAFGGFDGMFNDRGNENAVVILTDDPQGRVAQVRFLGPDDAVIQSGMQTSSLITISDKTYDYTSYNFAEKLPEGTQLEIVLITDKSLLAAPFTLKDVPLP